MAGWPKTLLISVAADDLPFFAGKHLHFVSICLRSILCALPLSTTAGLLQQWFDKFCRVYITSASVIKDYHEARFRMAKIEKCVRLLELH